MAEQAADDAPTPRHRPWDVEDDQRDPSLKIELALMAEITGPTWGPWHVAWALVRDPNAPPTWVPGHENPEYAGIDPGKVWESWLDKGGNGISTLFLSYWIANAADAPAIMAFYDDLWQRGNPYGVPVPMVVAKPVTPAIAEEPDEDDMSTDNADSWKDVVLPGWMSDLASWRLCVELIRRHPADLWLVRTYPMDGQYDCLTVRRLTSPGTGPSIFVNRNGSHALIEWFGDSRARPSDAPIVSWTAAWFE
jgi:hypothetical protein